MERNNKLPKIKKFENEKHFYTHLFKLLSILYPKATISEHTITFQDVSNFGIVISITTSHLHPNTSQEFREEHTKFSKSGNDFLFEINTEFKWKGHSGYGYAYPRDRDMFQDSVLGMEQKACYFLVVIQVVLQYLKTN